jgi:hypothetical protein
MSEKEIVQNMISRLGQSQADRSPAGLDPHGFPVDGRSPADLLAQARALSQNLRYYRDSATQPVGDWGDFFPPGDDKALLTRKDGGVPPHLGLFGAFAGLYPEAQRDTNKLTAKHLDFQMRRVLGFEHRGPQPDHAHLLCELKKGVPPVKIERGRPFTAGKDAKGVPLIYESVRDAVVNHASLAALHSVYRGSDGLRFASIANSADGLGAPMKAEHPGWSAFGGPYLPFAQPGFALSGAVLRMAEGKRTIYVTLKLEGIQAASLDAAAFEGGFEAFLTGPKSWIGPFTPKAKLGDGALELSFEVPETSPAVVDYQPAAHGQIFSAQAPVVQFVLTQDTASRYDAFTSLSVRTAHIRVKVDEVRNLILENDAGSLNPKKAYLPFGPQPVRGSRFMIGSEEALGKKLLELELRLHWQGAPEDLYTWYSGYSKAGRFADGVEADLTYADRTGQVKSAKVGVMARNPAEVTQLNPAKPPTTVLTLGNSTDRRLFALLSGGSLFSRLMGTRLARSKPMHARKKALAPEPRSGFITLSLHEDFLHGDYRHETVYNIVNKVMDNGILRVLNEPYTPKVQDTVLYYEAESEEAVINDVTEAAFTDADLQFFQVGCFGTRREHAWLRSQLPYLGDNRVTLLPHYAGEGEFIIGLDGIGPGDGVSLLFQVADGSADPEASAQNIEWSVLADNHWRRLTRQELSLDTSRDFRATGIISMSLPAETALETTWLPSGHVWLRGLIREHVGAACRLIDVATNAVEVRFSDQGNDPGHLAQPLAAGGIAKMQVPAPGIKTIKQPEASFGGKREESDAHLARRAAERLRHRDRCITPWDYERLLLEAFPSVHKIKCIPHSTDASWLAPGHLSIIAVADLRNRNALNPLEPKVDLDTLTRMAEVAAAHAGMGVKVHVRNPRYEQVHLDFAVRFMPGLPFNFYAAQLQEDLIRELSPWAWDGTKDMGFGGILYRSVLLEFVETREYVDYVTRFRMGWAGIPGSDFPELRPGRPDAILVSDSVHAIAEA